ncbi:MAG: murD [Gammaproteobacteria bacterium]|jgi:UDP-N-acetylmuramoylalanine--D-glutamate ligase|nr:murD [Gammaproteobacteria bacterium]
MYAIIGLGQTGLSIAQFLYKQNVHFFVCDTRESPPGLAGFKALFPAVEIFLGALPEEKLLQAEKIVLSPGLSRATLVIQKAIKHNIPVIGDIELFVQQAKAPIIAITGTNAKGTVTTMVESILKAAGKEVCIGGNYGIPALDLLAKPIPDFYVLELSSYQLESTFSLQAAAATILNVTSDHLDYHATMENYLAAKQRIYHNAKSMVVNADDEATWPAETKGCIYAFGSHVSVRFNPAYCFSIDNKNLMFNKQTILSAEELLVAGVHNWLNALAAAALTTAVGISLEAIREGLKNFRGLKHRCVLVETIHGVKWYNDSKGTNVGATQAALAGLGPTLTGRIILIAGGQGKGQDFSPLQTLCKQYVKTLILFGQDADQLEQTLKPTVFQCLRVKNLEEAVQVAKACAQPGDAVLLSPACASLDMFKNYEQRGEKFEELVKLQ